MTYTAQYKLDAISLADKIGPHQAVKQLGISANTLRRWRDPEYQKREQAQNAARQRIPCRNKCGNFCGKYNRKRKEYEGLCKTCMRREMADAQRGVSLAEMIDMYVTKGMSTNEIATAVGRSQTAVYDLLKQNGVQMRPRRTKGEVGGQRGGGQHHGKVDKKKIIAMRHNEKMSLNAIASELGVAVNTVRYHLRDSKAA